MDKCDQNIDRYHRQNIYTVMAEHLVQLNKVPASKNEILGWGRERERDAINTLFDNTSLSMQTEISNLAN